MIFYLVGEGKSFYICTRFGSEAMFIVEEGVSQLMLKLLKETKIFIKKVLVGKEKALYICTRFEREHTFRETD